MCIFVSFIKLQVFALPLNTVVKIDKEYYGFHKNTPEKHNLETMLIPCID